MLRSLDTVSVIPANNPALEPLGHLICGVAMLCAVTLLKRFTGKRPPQQLLSPSAGVVVQIRGEKIVYLRAPTLGTQSFQQDHIRARNVRLSSGRSVVLAWPQWAASSEEMPIPASQSRTAVGL